MNIKISVMFCFFFLWSQNSFASELIKELVSESELIANIQSGGYVIYMRHGPTNHSQKDIERSNLDDCSSQRNLSDQGRIMMRQIGERLADLNIPIEQVYSSPYCRCRDTAKLVFGKYNIEENLKFSIGENKEESHVLGRWLFDSIMKTDNNQGNTVFVGHTSNLKDGLGVWPKPEGVMAIFKKRKDRLVYKGMIRPDFWLNQHQ
jgi:phosphohistidine phosphatase SixA